METTFVVMGKFHIYGRLGHNEVVRVQHSVCNNTVSVYYMECIL